MTYKYNISFPVRITESETEPSHVNRLWGEKTPFPMFPRSSLISDYTVRRVEQTGSVKSSSQWKFSFFSPPFDFNQIIWNLIRALKSQSPPPQVTGSGRAQNSIDPKLAATLGDVCSLVHSWKDCSWGGIVKIILFVPFHVKEPLKGPAGSQKRLCFASGRRGLVLLFVLFCGEKLWFVHFNMAAYTLPEGFTEFDMFTFGTALLVGGKWTERPRKACVLQN